MSRLLCKPTSLRLVCPVRPPLYDGSQDDDGWEDISSGPVEALAGESRDAIDLDDEVDGDLGTVTRVPRGLPEPHEPTPLERARHNLTHWPYKSWCEHCVRSRRPNSQHRYSPSSSERTLPVFVSDYCFLRDSRDEDTAPCFVGRLYPSRSVFGTVVAEKGIGDEHAVKLLADFFRENGVVKMVYKSDQESALKAFVDAALRQIGGHAKEDDDLVTCVVPEYSAVGESPSNGKAERVVQQVEDQVRTLKSALESHINARVVSNHAIMQWLVRHSCMILTSFSVNPDGQTPYQSLHGKRAPDRLVEFGELVYYHVPKKLRHKLDLRWRLGVYLGMANVSNEHFVGLPNGNIAKSRSVVRTIASKRWRADLIEKVTGTPAQLVANGNRDELAGIESFEDPHAGPVADAEVELDAMEVKPVVEEKHLGTLDRQIRITMKDLKTHGFYGGCPRCADLESGNMRTNKHHSNECRLTMYKKFETTNDPKWRAVKHLLEKPEDRPVDADDTKKDGPSISARNESPVEAEPPAHSTNHDEPNQRQDEAFDWEEHLGDSSVLDGQKGNEHIDEDHPFGSPVEDDVLDDLLEEMDEDPSEISGHMVDAFLLAGADPHKAKDHVKTILDKRPTTFVEVFGRGGICDEANGPRRNLNLVGLNAFDMRTTKPDGDTWDFSRQADRRLARRILEEQKPDWVIGSPPCTAFSIWNVAMNYPKAVDQQAVQDAIAAGRRHLRFVISIYWKQVKNGRHFLHEHPATAVSWKDEAMLRLMKFPGVHVTVADQCMYGLTSPSPGGEKLPAKKPTRFLTSSSQMAARLSTRCNKLHSHQQLVGGRCRDAAFYPLGLIRAILLGMSDTRDAEAKSQAASLEVRQKINAISSSAGEIPCEDEEARESSAPYANGKTCRIVYDSLNFRPKYVDEYTGEVLDPKLVKEAIIDELDYFNARVWHIAHVDEMKQTPDYIRTRSRWVGCNKGDSDNPDVRFRLVSCEINKGGEKPMEFFASTPPLEAQRLMFSRFASEPEREIGGKMIPVQLSFVDIRKAYFNGIPKRAIFMDLPRELGLGREYVAKLVRCCYGRRDAGAIWEDCYRDALEAMGFQSGISSPCMFHHKSRNLSVVVHGDDFNALGIATDLNWYESELAKFFEIKIRGRMGPGGDCEEIKILNRILRITDQGLTYEADPRHTDLLLSSMNLTESNSVATPGVKDPEADYDAVKHNESSSQPRINDEGNGDVVCSIKSDKRVDFCLGATTIHEVPAYSTIYGRHPSLLKSGRSNMQSVNRSVDRFTSKSARVMTHRRKSLRTSTAAYWYRLRILAEANQSLGTLHDTTTTPRLPPFKFWGRDDATCDDVDMDADMDVDTTIRQIICANRTAPIKKKGGAKSRQGAKKIKNLERLVSVGYELCPEEATMFRALSARANFLAQDRPDIAFSTKELCREFAIPNRNSYARLKRVVRYLAGLPRLVYRFDYQPMPTHADIYTDTDFAGCKESRRSTSGGVLMLGGHTIRHWAKTQPTIALSSGEAELGGIGTGIAEALGFASSARDLGWDYKLNVHTDASAAIGIARRRGLGKVRHLDVTDLWVQEKVRSKAVALLKIAGDKNPADALTKYVERPILTRALATMNLVKMEGRPAMAPKAMGTEA